MKRDYDFGVIFDWDGVIIDSMENHRESWYRTAEENNLQVKEGFFEDAFGRKNAHIISNMLEWSSEPAEIKTLSDRKEAHYREIMLEKGVKPLTGVVELLGELSSADIPCAVGSSTDRFNIDTALKQMPFNDCFQTIVTAEDVHHGKPDPEVFLICASRMGIEPKYCVVVEDAVAGVDAAHRGGMKVIAVPTTRHREVLQHADLVVDRLDEVTLTDLMYLLGIDPAA
jgi:beta-phosphoglucomutase family hydrolase